MPISSKGFARTSLALIVIGLMALVGVVGTTMWLVERTQVYLDEVVEARTARRAAVELRNLMQDAQSGQRGSILTSDEDYLVPYEAALVEIDSAYGALVDSLGNFPEAATPLQTLRGNMDVKLAELAETIALTRDGRVDDAVAIVRTDTGETLMNEIRGFLDAVMLAADERTFTGVVDQRNAVGALRVVTILGALIIISIVAGAAFLVLRYTRELDFAREEVEQLNRDLEGRVAERTTDLMRANEEVQRFAYIVTHDLRAPLVNIMGFTSELEAALGPINALVEKHGGENDDPVIADARLTAQEDLPEAIGFIRSSTKKMDGLINAILKISREGRRDLAAERIDLAEFVQSSVDAVQHQIADSGGEARIDVAAPPIFTDRLALGQVLGNLLDNAIKYRHPDRPVEVDIKGRQERDGRIVIDVTDNGRGISGEDHDRVFELFRRSGNQNVAGEGIGLAHVRIMARNLGGDIALQSQLGKGTTFTVSIAPDLRALARTRKAQ